MWGNIVSEQTAPSMAFPELSAYQKAILTAMEIPLFVSRAERTSELAPELAPELRSDKASDQKLGHVPADKSSVAVTENRVLTPHPLLRMTADLQLFLADTHSAMTVFVHEDVVLDERGIGLPVEVNATHKKRVWALLQAHLAKLSK